MKKIILTLSATCVFSLLNGCATPAQTNQTLAGMTQILQQSSTANGATQPIGTSQTAQTATQVVGLIDILVQQMGISQTQAQLGAGALFQVAKTQMQPAAFAQLERSVPGMGSMLAAASTAHPSAAGGVLGAVAAASGNSTINSAVSLATAFQQQGLAPTLVQQFVPVVLQYVTNTSGSATASALSMALIGR